MDDNEKKVETVKEKGNRLYKFRSAWMEMEEFKDWLEKNTKKTTKNSDFDYAYCKFCECSLFARKADLIKHKQSVKHKKNETKIIWEIENERAEQCIENLKRSDNAKKAQSSLSAYATEQNLVADSLVSLCKNIFSDSDIASNVGPKRSIIKINIKKAVGNIGTKHEATSTIYSKGNIGTKHAFDATSTTYSKLRGPGMFFSINMDETMDHSGIKQYTLTVAFMDGEKGVKYSIFDKFTVKPGPAINIYSSLKNSILSRGIPLENLVGFSSGCYSVFPHLQKDCPDIAYVKFSCHTIPLAVSKACLKLPEYVEDLLRNLGSHFSHTYGKQASFKEFQEFFHVDIHTIALTSRWLSIRECVDRVLEQYDPLQTYIRQFCSDDDPSDTDQTIFDTMKNPFTKAYLDFMSYILGILCEFNELMFEKERPLRYKMKPKVEKFIKNISLNFLLTDYVKITPAFEIEYKDPEYYLPLDEIYVGIGASEIICDLSDTEEKEIKSFFQNVLNFYVELVTVVIEEFDDELLNIISILDPQVAQECNTISLMKLWKRFPVLKQFINVQALDNEWRQHALLDYSLEGLDPRLPYDDYWTKVFRLKSPSGDQAFPNLYAAMKLLLVLPFFPSEVLKSKQCNLQKVKPL